MRAIAPTGHYEPVKADNGVDAYCMKTDTRIDGPFELGKKPARNPN